MVKANKVDFLPNFNEATTSTNRSIKQPTTGQRTRNIQLIKNPDKANVRRTNSIDARSTQVHTCVNIGQIVCM